VSVPPTRIAVQPMRFEPPRLSSSGTGRISRASVGVGALNEAREEGRQQALAEMEHLVEQHRRAKLDAEQAGRALNAAAMQLRLFDQETLGELEQQVVALALAVAREILGREARTFDDVVLGSVMKAMSLTPDRGAVVLQVNPADRASVLEYLASADHRQEVDVVSDHGVERGGCIAANGPLLVDAQIRSAVERIAAALAE
jgi:flagellar assembly protein FliH